ncbi:MAG: ABC transporter permease, partial [Actinobacteria bacterium]|nr:ABC transporter permease [Actinomycetota bacterium]
MSAFLSQLRTELTLSARQGEQILVSIGIPLLVLVFFSNVDILPSGPGDTPVDYLVPAVLALAVMSTALVSLGIGTGFERHYGVLKRLGASPLGRRRWVAAKMSMVLIIEVVQWTVLMGVGLLLGWSPPASGWVAAIVAGLLGTAAFGGLGLFLAGTLPGITTL